MRLPRLTGRAGFVARPAFLSCQCTVKSAASKDSRPWPFASRAPRPDRVGSLSMLRGSWGLRIDGLNATWQGHNLYLTRSEQRILCELLRVAPAAIDRDELCARVFSQRTGARRVDVHISHLRAKLKGTSVRIPPAASRGGYSLTTRQPSILIAEANSTLRRALTRALEVQFDALVSDVAHIEAARSLLECRPYDLVVVEGQLASAEGGARALVDCALTNRARVVAVSADASFASMAFSRGVPFLLKPFTLGHLCDVVRGELRRHSDPNA